MINKFSLSPDEDDEVEFSEWELELHSDDEKVSILLDERESKRLKMRLSRSFCVRWPKQKLLDEIDGADAYNDLEAITKKYSLCDACDFHDINVYGVKRVLKVVVDMLYRYPMLRSRMCFIGTLHGFEKLVERLEQGDMEVLKCFSFQYICSQEEAKGLGRLMHKTLNDEMSMHDSFVAVACDFFDLINVMLFDKNDYESYAYMKLLSGIKASERSGFAPKGCTSAESVVYHEMAHLLDYMCKINGSEDFKKYYESLTEYEISHGLSQYALESPAEFIAEGFAEFMCNPSPRPIALKVGELIDAAYKRASQT